MRKSQTTLVSERRNVSYDMWRKKVDNSLFRSKGTTIPRWLVTKWELEKYFPDVKGVSSKKDKSTETTIMFNNKT